VDQRRIRQGDVHWLALPRPGAVERPHPHVVVQDDVLNDSRIDTVVVCALTSNPHRADEPGNVLLRAGEADLPRPSVVVVSQLTSVEKEALGSRIGSLSRARVAQILRGLRFQQAYREGRRREEPVLYVFAGLPGVGKTTLSQRLARHSAAVHLRIDTIEQGLRDLCGLDVQGEGYRLSYRVAADNLRLGRSVVADSCNPIALTRQEWRDVAAHAGASTIDIEVVCSDPDEHRRRVEGRQATVPGLVLPSWTEVLERTYDVWETPRVLVDTAGRTEDACFEALLDAIGA